MGLVYLIAISLLSTVFFGIIDGSLFILAEEFIQTQLIKIPFFDINMAELATGGISTSMALFVASFIRDTLHKYHHIIENPFLDLLGVLIGTSILLGIYYLYKTYKEEIIGEAVAVFNQHNLDVIEEKLGKI
jgi:hypothetical protein